jgi:hypothetical protein
MIFNELERYNTAEVAAEFNNCNAIALRNAIRKNKIYLKHIWKYE